MKLLSLILIVVATTTAQNDPNSHFQLRGNENQQSQGGQNQHSQGGSTRNSFNDRSQSRFQTSPRGQQLIDQQQRQQSRTPTTNQQNQFQSNTRQNQFQNHNQQNNNEQNQNQQNQFQSQQNQRQHSQQVSQPQTSSFQQQQNTRSQPQQVRNQQIRTQQTTSTRQPSTTTTTAPSKSPASSSNTPGQLLSLPEAALCAARPKQWQFNGHNYYFSWDQNDVDEATGEPRKVDWLEARNRCREKCMDAIGIETEAENNMVIKFLNDRKLRYIWTSGRICDFTGCAQRRDLHPINIFGWFWSNTNTKTAPTNSTPPGWIAQPWSQTGHNKKPQPDNAEFGINQTSESCLAILNDIYKDGVSWHDIACYHKKPYICEDSELLLNYVRSRNPGIQL